MQLSTFSPRVAGQERSVSRQVLDLKVCTLSHSCVCWKVVASNAEYMSVTRVRTFYRKLRVFQARHGKRGLLKSYRLGRKFVAQRLGWASRAAQGANTKGEVQEVVNPVLACIMRVTPALLVALAAGHSVVFVKTYKTGSTTVSEFLSLVAYRDNLYSLHPEAHGNFREDELSTRAAKGQVYDLFYRHPTPRLDELSLRILVPDALWVTIIREPVSRFLSAYSFVKRLSRRYSVHQLVDNVHRLTPGDANTFCDNFAFVLGGGADRRGENATAAFERLVDKLDRDYLVLVQDDMKKSLALLADRAGFAGIAEQRIGRARASKMRKPPCDESCRLKILSCNQVDSALYDYFKRKFATLRVDTTAASTNHLLPPPPEFARYPVNCHVLGSKTGPPRLVRWKKLHSCSGKTGL